MFIWNKSLVLLLHTLTHRINRRDEDDVKTCQKLIFWSLRLVLSAKCQISSLALSIQDIAEKNSRSSEKRQRPLSFSGRFRQWICSICTNTYKTAWSTGTGSPKATVTFQSFICNMKKDFQSLPMIKFAWEILSGAYWCLKIRSTCKYRYRALFA